MRCVGMRMCMCVLLCVLELRHTNDDDCLRTHRKSISNMHFTIRSLFWPENVYMFLRPTNIRADYRAVWVSG